MAGIVGAGACIPRYRLPREVIAKEWGTAAAGGEKAIANHDEDSLTLAVNAAGALAGDGPPPDNSEQPEYDPFPDDENDDTSHMSAGDRDRKQYPGDDGTAR